MQHMGHFGISTLRRSPSTEELISSNKENSLNHENHGNSLINQENKKNGENEIKVTKKRQNFLRLGSLGSHNTATNSSSGSGQPENEQEEDYRMNVLKVKKEKHVPGKFRGAPKSRKDMLILHVCTIAWEKRIVRDLRPRDIKVLKNLKTPVREVVSELYLKISVFDYEIKGHRYHVYDRFLNPANVLRRIQRQLSREATDMPLAREHSEENSLLKEANKKVKEHGVQIHFAKQKERSLSTQVLVYFLVVRPIKLNENLPFQSDVQKIEQLSGQTSITAS